jgi:hypothetical protein
VFVCASVARPRRHDGRRRLCPLRTAAMTRLQLRTCSTHYGFDRHSSELRRGRDGPTATRQDAQIDHVGRLWRGAGQTARDSDGRRRPYAHTCRYSGILVSIFLFAKNLCTHCSDFIYLFMSDLLYFSS